VSELTTLKPLPRIAPALVERRLDEWRRLLRQSTTQGRAVLQRLLGGRLTFTPRADGTGYDFGGQTRFDKLFAGSSSSGPIGCRRVARRRSRPMRRGTSIAAAYSNARTRG
jgi:hypothetical protein